MANAKHWTFTVFDDKRLPLDEAHIHYSVYQFEKCPNTGRIHIQGYVQFRAKRRMRQVKEWLGRQDAHVEAMRGTARQARDYCMKRDTRLADSEPIELGRFSENARPKLTDFFEKHMYTTDREAIEDDPVKYAAHYRALDRMKLHMAPSARGPVEIILLEGDLAHTSAKAMEMAPHAFVHNGTRWWDGYTSQEAVIFLDGMEHVSSRMRLPIPCRVEVKGGYVALQATTFYICSSEWGSGLPNHHKLIRCGGAIKYEEPAAPWAPGDE